MGGERRNKTTRRHKRRAIQKQQNRGATSEGRGDAAEECVYLLIHSNRRGRELIHRMCVFIQSVVFTHGYSRIMGK